MKSIKNILILATATLTALAVFGGEQTAEVPTRVDMVLISATAKVTAIDYETRDVTLQDELGKEVVIKASEDVERLNEITVDDLIMVDYYISMAYELRNPTAEELANPLQIVEVAGKADMETDPGAGAISTFKAVCVIEGLDRPTETVTLMGPLGGLNVVKVADVANLPALHIGQSVVVTFTQAMAISLEKVEKVD